MLLIPGSLYHLIAVSLYEHLRCKSIAGAGTGLSPNVGR
jgi:hypothetical protein